MKTPLVRRLALAPALCLCLVGACQVVEHRQPQAPEAANDPAVPAPAPAAPKVALPFEAGGPAPADAPPGRGGPPAPSAAAPEPTVDGLIADLAHLKKQRLEIVAAEAKKRELLRAKLAEQRKRLEDLGVGDGAATPAPPAPVTPPPSAPAEPINRTGAEPRR